MLYIKEKNKFDIYYFCNFLHTTLSFLNYTFLKLSHSFFNFNAGIKTDFLHSLYGRKYNCLLIIDLSRIILNNIMYVIVESDNILQYYSKQ